MFVSGAGRGTGSPEKCACRMGALRKGGRNRAGMTTNWIEELAGSGTFTAAFRLLLAMVCGGVLGLNREHKRRPAGLRTYMLVCMSAALVMLTSQFAVGKQASAFWGQEPF